MESLQQQLQLIEALEERNRAQLDSFLDEQDQWESLDPHEQQLLLSRERIEREMESVPILHELHQLLDGTPKNGIGTPLELQRSIKDNCDRLESINPNPKPCNDAVLLNGFWYMLYTDYSPPGPSSGKLGPFVGNVYQDLHLDGRDPGNNIAHNIFRLQSSLLPMLSLMGDLTAIPQRYDDTTVAITFDKVGTKVCGILPLGPNIRFPKGQEVRLWNHVYVDDTYRILYAKNAAAAPAKQTENDVESAPTTNDDRGFLYIMKRADNERFVTNI
jgi:hypothetical protein